ncbi:hypothetical protein BCR32DRAFT_283857 [Anaeromyces robustus]|uniref:Uncharacterized protein n=1 Tax=Anaeromyces robustus TaxID=1754192 RepID=A0A1Y1WT86_9FUNG|nr:hypothetical protein BCR32DRAFT_283857 [Anaeromyces robustus]|eukprot:ORX76747.1 hypothetical protein BCR32DRAFT_283857 [Anaeromyces robustus]
MKHESVNTTIFSDVLSDDFTIDKYKLSDSLSNDCIEEEKNSEYNVCIPNMTIGNYKESCLNIKSEKCQKFYSDPDKSKYFPICSKNPLYNEYLQPLVIEYIENVLESQCFTDENGDLCPYSIYAITNTGGRIFTENCKSKKCTELVKDAFKKISMEHLSALIYYISFLQKPEQFNFIYSRNDYGAIEVTGLVPNFNS